MMSQSTVLQDAGSVENLVLSLDKYLDSALHILAGWESWLEEHQRRVVLSQVDELEAHATSANDLHADLNRLTERRAQLLAQAREAGFTCSNLKQVAESLPQWHRHSVLRNRVRMVERSMANLRRLTTATWLLVSQCSKVVDDTLMLMTSGSALHGAYVHSPHADTIGGQILDTQI